MPFTRILSEDAQHQTHLFDALLSATADFNYIFDRAGRFSYVNRALLTLLGRTREEVVGRNFHDLQYPPELASKLQAQIESVFVTGKRLKDETPYTNFEGQTGYYEYIFVPIFDRQGEVEAVAGSTRDFSEHRQAQAALKASESALSESEKRLAELNRNLERLVVERTQALEHSSQRLEASLKEKVVLLREVHHRVKNNLQVVSSLLRMQSYSADPATSAVLVNSQHRIRSMALIHELLYQSKDLSRINFKTYLESLLENLFRAYAAKERHFSYTIDADDVHVTLDKAIPCGLITNELVSNALNHAFLGCDGGTLQVSFRRQDKDGLLCVADNGRGLPEAFDWRNAASLGLTIIRSLCNQLNGDALFSVNSGGGTCFTFRFKLE